MEGPDFVSHTTRLLRGVEAGEPGASDELYTLLYARLRELAHGVLGSGAHAPTLQPTALVHEVWMRLAANPVLRADDRRHFLRIAARAMRAVVVDHARKRGALRRDAGRERVPLDAALDAWSADETLDPLELDELLSELKAHDARLAEVVEMRFFGGMTEPEVADALELTERQVQHAWKLARAWLARELERRGA